MERHAFRFNRNACRFPAQYARKEGETMRNRQRKIYAALVAPILASTLLGSGVAFAETSSDGFSIMDDYEWSEYRKTFEGEDEDASESAPKLKKNASREDIQKYIKESLNSNKKLDQNIKINGRKDNDDGTARVAITYYGPDNTQKNIVVEMGKDGNVYDANTAMSDQQLQAAYDEIVYGGQNAMSVYDIISVNEALHAKTGAYLQNVSDALGIDTGTASQAAAGAVSLAGVVILGAGSSAGRKKEILDAAVAEAEKKARGNEPKNSGGSGSLTGSTGNAEYDDMIVRAASAYDIPANLLFCLLNQESGFNPNAVSPCGAIGIAQFMPDTAESLGVDPSDPGSAIPGAAKLLRMNYDTFGSWELALAAYNAGAGAVEKYGGIPPYRETQNYVSSIMNAYQSMPQPTQEETASKAGVSSLVDTAFAKVDGRRSPYGSRGCADTVACAGSFYNADLKEEFLNGVASVQTLVSDLESKGYACRAFDGYAEKGDLLVYGDNDHVVISDGAGGCFGNSSGKGYAMHYKDAAYAWKNGELPSMIIKMV